jgi:predicted amidohydrolase
MSQGKSTGFRAGFVQFCPERYDVDRNIVKVERLLRHVQADLLILPELANSGYMYASPRDLASYAEMGDGSGPFLTALRRLAVDTGAAIVSGFAERSVEGLYNSAAAISPVGLLQVYRKTHLYADEKSLFLPGDTGFRLFEWRGIRVGMMICFDWHFPESARTLALRGAEIIAHPANLVMPFCQTAMVTRCLENRVFAITANRYGAETLDGKTLTFTGASQMLDTLGRRLLQAPGEGDLVAVSEIQPFLADDKRVGARNHLFDDRRPEMYD